MAVGDTESCSRGDSAGFDFGHASPSSNSRRSTRYYGSLPPPQQNPGPLPAQPNWERPQSTQMSTSHSSSAAPHAGPTIKNKPERAESSEKQGTAERVCAKCKNPIAGHFVRALGASWHIECFTCVDCGDQCAKKFFPDPDHVEGSSVPQRPLCEHCYFARLDLLCFRCNDSLRGSYITALDRKYHIEHFTCSVCPLTFGPDDSYYEHDGDVFCQFHYSRLHAACCEGCGCAILKQFVETYRGGIEHQWHPECYMIFKFWNVKLASAVAPPHLAESTPEPTDEERTIVANHDTYIDKLVLETWSTLCGFEETTAAAISQMLQCAVNNSYELALSTTRDLVGSVQVLFEAIQKLQGPSRVKLNKEPKTLCRKVVAYMSIVSKARQNELNQQQQAPDLLGVANSLAHYLKVLIRYGLSTALLLDREAKDRDHTILHNFLKDVAKYQHPPAAMAVSALTSDRCVDCQKTVEDNCLCSRDRLWHTTCFKCFKCQRELPVISPGSSATIKSTPVGEPLCTDCDEKESVTVDSEFSAVGRLSQYAFLLYVAIARFELVLGQSTARDAAANSASVSTPALSRPVENSLSPQIPSFRRGSSEEVRDRHYLSTVTDARNVRDKQEKKISTSPSANTSATLGTLSSDSANTSANTTAPAALERTSDLLHSKSALTLDDIRRIVAAEQAREQMPNAYRHQQQGVEDMLEISAKVNGNKRESGDVPCYFADLSPEDYRIVSKIATFKLFELLVPKYMSEEELTNILHPPAQSIWAKMGKALGSNRPKRFGVFGIDLETLIDKSGVDSTLGVGGYTLRIPSFLEEVINAMRQKDMSVEGVFRKNGNIKRIRDFQDIADKGVDIGGMLAEENIIQLAALLKTFLRNMPTPLMGNKAGRLCALCVRVDHEEREPLIRLLICLMDRQYRDVLEVLATFLNWSASFSALDDEAGSKMDAHNLATVITPNIVPSSKEGAQPDHYLQAIEATSMLIKHHTFTARAPADVWQLLTKIKEAHPKDKLSQKEISDFIRSI